MTAAREIIAHLRSLRNERDIEGSGDTGLRPGLNTSESGHRS
jgi:hypothetical protein